MRTMRPSLRDNHSAGPRARGGTSCKRSRRGAVLYDEPDDPFLNQPAFRHFAELSMRLPRYRSFPSPLVLAAVLALAVTACDRIAPAAEAAMPVPPPTVDEPASV